MRENITGDYELHSRVNDISLFEGALSHGADVQMYKCTYIIYSHPPTNII